MSGGFGAMSACVGGWDVSAAARALIAARVAPVRLVLFDCDGVLIDSEPIANRIVAEELSAIGWALSAAECDRIFLGVSYHDVARMAEKRLGCAVPEGWLAKLLNRVSRTLAMEAIVVPGAPEALLATAMLGLEWVVASNSSQEEMAAKFSCVGLDAVVRGRTHSGHDVVRAGGLAKPAPDLFLAAAASMGVAAAHCLVIEDSPIGARAARAAGMSCLGLARLGQDAELAALGAAPFASMHDLPGLLRAAQAGAKDGAGRG